MESKCNDCPCGFEYITICEVVPKCTTELRIYVAETEKNVVIAIKSFHNFKVILFQTKADVFGYATIKMPKWFLNSFGDAVYEICVSSIFNDNICLEYACKKATHLRFKVDKCINNTIFTLNEPCIKALINCTTIVPIPLPIICNTIIEICTPKSECVTMIQL